MSSSRQPDLPSPNLWARLSAPVAGYMAHPDPLAAHANWIALLVASSQPFYPLYVWWAVSGTIWPVFFTWLSTPFFLAVPFVARRNSFAGRALLVLAGIGNTLMSAALFGTTSGVELFLLPCLTIAFLHFRPGESAPGKSSLGERWFSYAIAGALAFAFLYLRGWYGASPIHAWTADELAAFLSLNAMSTGGLMCVVGMVRSDNP